MEGVCEKMKDYGETLDPATNRKMYVRFTAREGMSEDISNVSYDSRVTADLKFAVRVFLLARHQDQSTNLISFSSVYSIVISIYNHNKVVVLSE